MAAAKENDIWAKFREFDDKFKQLFEKFAEKFADADEPDEAELGACPDSYDPEEEMLAHVRVDSDCDMGKILVAAADFSRSDLVLAENPALALPSNAFQRMSQLREALANIDADFDFSDYEASLAAAPAEIAELLGSESRSLHAYMVFRINGMQWGRHQIALFKLASKAPHSCCPNTIFGQRTTESGNYRLEVRAVQAISNTQQITYDYLDHPDDLLCPTFIRRRILHSQRFFVCACSRCKAADHGDPCRNFPCPCGHRICVISQGLKWDDSRYASDRDIVSTCAKCGRSDIEQSLLDLEEDASKDLEELLITLGDTSVMNLTMFVEVSAIDNNEFDALGRIDQLYSRTRPLGKSHWIFCRASLLKWRAILTEARLKNVPVSDDTILAESIDFVEEQCPELLPSLVAAWVAEAAKFLMEIVESDAPHIECLPGASALVVYAQFQRVAHIAHFDPTERWFLLFQKQASIDLSAPD